jgi:FkbM family methyltransferase
MTIASGIRVSGRRSERDSLKVLRRCGVDARVLAFEPALHTFVYLERNLGEALPYAPVRAYCCALGESSLYSAPQTTRGSLVKGAARAPSGGYRTAVPTWLRDVPRGTRIDYLKIGVEGAELEVDGRLADAREPDPLGAA